MGKKLLELEKKYHDRVAQKFNNQRKHDFIWEIPEKLFIFKNKYFNNKSIVDMGCGPSISIKKATKNINFKVKNYIGIDISSKMISLAKKNYPNGTYIIDDITNTNLPNSSADTILSLGALHHTENKYITLSNWIRILKEGGFLLIREPIYEALKRGTGASPIEEGIKVTDICNYLRTKKLFIHSKIFFCSPLFHIVNRFFTKIFGDIWLNNELFWYPIMIVDILASNIFGYFSSSFKGDACIIIAQKI